MVGSKRFLVIGAAVLLSWGGTTVSPAWGEAVVPATFSAHTSAVDPGGATSQTWSGAAVHVEKFRNGVTAVTDSVDGHRVAFVLEPPSDQELQAGTTYRTSARGEESTPESSLMRVYQDGLMCGRGDSQQLTGDEPATGWVAVHELERDGTGAIIRFRATYELDCQTLGPELGGEGSIALDPTAPADPVPTVAPIGSVRGLHAVNVGPDGIGSNSTTLSWVMPAGASDVVVDVVQSADTTKLPAQVGGWMTVRHVGAGTSFEDPYVDFMDTRTYRVVPRTSGGRLGPAALLTVRGTRLSLPPTTQRVQVGDRVHVSGRLSESWDYVDPADVMKGPGLVGQRVVLCRQARTPFVFSACDVVARTTTTADGRFDFDVRPVENSFYNVQLPATPSLVGNTCPVMTTALVSPQTDLVAPSSQVAEARAGVVRRGSVIRFSTSRARTGSSGTVRLQRLDGRTWRTLVTKRIATSGPRRMAIPYRERTAGAHQYRVTKSPDSRHVTGYSKIVRVRVG